MAKKGRKYKVKFITHRELAERNKYVLIEAFKKRGVEGVVDKFVELLKEEILKNHTPVALEGLGYFYLGNRNISVSINSVLFKHSVAKFFPKEVIEKMKKEGVVVSVPFHSLKFVLFRDAKKRIHSLNRKALKDAFTLYLLSKSMKKINFPQKQENAIEEVEYEF